ncbi:MAG: caspase family protein [Thermoleophilia bacterium]|nr:caspase family protein [Thermoleophilia bacterium]
MQFFRNKTVLSFLTTLFVFLGLAGVVASNEPVAPATVIAQTGFGKGIDEPVVIEQPSRKKFAIVIGIVYDNYELGEISYADQDAGSMYRLLTERFGFPRENVILLQNAQANRKNILDAFGWLADNPDIDEESDVVVFYSGHGLRTAPDAGLNLPGVPEAYALVPFDFMNFDYKKGQGLFWDAELAAYLDGIDAGRMWINIDSCFAGGFNRPGITGANRIVTMSSRSNELSSEIPEAQRGAMMQYMVEQGVARGLTIEQAYTQAVPWAFLRYGQNPLIADNYPGNMDLGISPRSPNN